MSPASQLIRLSIPGSIFVLAGVGTYAFAEVVWGAGLSEVQSLTTVTTSITAIAASIPIGFLVYQVYYWRYSPFVFGDLVTRDRGRDALWHLPPDVLGRLRTHFDARLDVRRHHRTVSTPVVRRLKLLRLNDELLRARYKDRRLVDTEEDEYLFEKDNRNLRRIYHDNWYENWDVFRAVLDLVAVEGKRPQMKEDFMALYDIYHSLGASRLAVVAGALTGVGYVALSRGADVSEQVTASVLGLLAVLVAAFTLAYVLHRTRIATWRSAIGKVRLHLTSSLTPDSPLVRDLLPEPARFTVRRELRREASRPHRRPWLRRQGDRFTASILGTVGLIEWTQATRGILGSGERRRHEGAVLSATALEAPRTLVGHLRRRGLGPDPSDVELPGTAFATEIEEACSELEPMVLEHGYRSYLFARALGALEGIACDEEALFAATMLHAHGFTEIEALEGACFTWRSIEVASGLLEDSPLSSHLRHDVLDAISLHLNPAVGPQRGALQHLTHDGVLLDLVGVRAWELDREGLERVTDVHPRHGLAVRADRLLRFHASRVPDGRIASLYRAGLGPTMTMSRWWAHDRAEAAAMLGGRWT